MTAHATGAATVALMLGLVVVAGGAGTGVAATAAPVEHAIISGAGPPVELWGSTGQAEIALRREGETSVTIVQGATVEHVDSGRLSERASYRSATPAWFRVNRRYGLTLAAARSALASGDQVERPPLMSAPAPTWDTHTYLRVWNFDTDVSALRRSVSFAVPMPGPTLAGLRLADVARVRVRGPGRAVDSGLTAMIVYSSAPARLGTDDRQLTLNVAAPGKGWGVADATVFRNSSDRLAGPGYDARLVNENQAILRYRGSYVGVRASWSPARSGWRALLQRIAS